VNAARGPWIDSTRRILPLAWPVVVGQVSMLAYATIDTLLVARTSAADLAALAVGGAAYVTIFIGLMGVLMALAPIVGQLHGAGQRVEAGRQVHQALYIAFGLGALGSTLLLFPQPFLQLARAGAEVDERVRAYLLALACSLPASLLFTVFRAFNTAVSRPKEAMKLQLAALLALKLPLTPLLVLGAPALGVPALGVLGCGVATAVAMWAQALLAGVMLHRDPFYAPYRLLGHGLQPPERRALWHHLKLGVPMGAGILVEVSAFTFMAIFIARLGTTPVAGHQLAINLASMLFMVPFGLGNATGTLVAQQLGAGALHDARRLGWHGLQLGCGVAALMGAAVYLLREPVLALYTQDSAVLAAALPLVAWLALFHVADAAQTIAAFVLRAHKIATVPMLIYVAALWGVGLGGGYLLAFDTTGHAPPGLQGARGFWFAATAGLVLAGVALGGFMVWVLRQEAGQRQAAGAT
jgi:MATE family multidrug resistance protein